MQDNQNKTNKFKKILSLVLAVIISLSAGLALGLKIYEWSLDDEMVSLIWAKKNIDKEYVGEITDEEFYSALYKGMNSCLDDYSRFMTKSQYADMKREATGEWNGLGIVFSTMDENLQDRMLVVRVCGNSPAEKVGVKEGDYVVGYKDENGEKVSTTKYDDFSNFLSQKQKSEKFYMYLENGGVEREVFISKEKFIETHVFYRTSTSENPIPSLPDSTAYIRLTEFIGDAGKEFDRAMTSFRNDGKKNLILDLRENGGGYMDVLCSIAKYFCKNTTKKSPVIVYALDKDGDREKFTTNGNMYYDYFAEDSKIYVLADNDTASASECLLGAMLDYGTVNYSDIFLSKRTEFDTENGVKTVKTVVKTFGKGIMQTTYSRALFSYNTEAIKLTTAHIYWPISNTCIHGRGITFEDGTGVLNENYSADAEIQEAISKIFH